MVRDPGCRINNNVSNKSRAASKPKAAVERGEHEEAGAHREDRPGGRGAHQ